MSSGLRVRTKARNPQAWNPSLAFPGGRDAQTMVPRGRCCSIVPHYTSHYTPMHTRTHTHTPPPPGYLKYQPIFFHKLVYRGRKSRVSLAGSTCLPADPCLSHLHLGPQRKGGTILACCSHSRFCAHTHGSEPLARPKREEHCLLYFLWGCKDSMSSRICGHFQCFASSNIPPNQPLLQQAWGGA